MKKCVLAFLILCATSVYSCNGLVIGFKGKDDIFDQQAFDNYARHLDYCGRSYSWHQIKEAQQQIMSTTVPYQLYGFSQGAVSVKNILSKANIRKPEFVLTVGAYKTADVNFNRYQVRYKNYFDHSGIGQASPGVFLNVPHNRIQQEVNKILNIWGQ
jgi:hypothetical protein